MHDFIRFLARHHGVLTGLRGSGPGGLRRAIATLQGLELPAGAWETKVLAARVDDYEVAWLDELTLTGEAVWGRLCPPRRREEDGPSQSGLNRAVPISLALRDDLSWLITRERPLAEPRLRGNAQVVLELLRARGALFYHELRRRGDLLPGHLDAALARGLAAAGFVSADSFGACGWMTAAARQRRGRAPRRRGHERPATVASAGRWSLFPPETDLLADDERLRRWARQLLDRWGVVFYDLLAREPLAPRWGQLVPALRRMEARGEIRGGRFVAGVAGEQYALPDVLEALRAARTNTTEPRETNGESKSELPAEIFVISAVDPLNLTGVLTREPRIASIHTSSLVIVDGRMAASKQSGAIELHGQLSPEMTKRVHEALRAPVRFGGIKHE